MCYFAILHNIILLNYTYNWTNVFKNIFKNIFQKKKILYFCWNTDVNDKNGIIHQSDGCILQTRKILRFYSEGYIILTIRFGECYMIMEVPVV